MVERSHTAAGKQAVMRAILLTILSLWIAPLAALGADLEPKVYFFWASGCPGCEDARKFLDKAQKDDPRIQRRDFDVEGSLGNAMLFDRIYVRIGMPGFGALPLIIIGTHVVIGYDDEGASEILNHIRDCRKRECLDIVDAVMRELSRDVEQTSLCAPTLAAAQGQAAATRCR